MKQRKIGKKKTYFIGLFFSTLGAISFADEHSTPHELNLSLNVIGGYQDSGWSWLDGGLGRFAYGAETHDTSALLELDIGYEYQFSPTLKFRTYAQAQHVDEGSSARNLGLVEWVLSYHRDIDFSQQVRFKLGQFFLPTSMENIDRFWDSPYTISYSSLNSWIGEEFRPIGLDAQYRLHLKEGGRASVGLTAFGGNDSMGALLAYRGWSYGRLKTVIGDVISLPALDSLADTGLFAKQRDDGTKPFGRDLDDHLGYALRALYEGERFSMSIAWVDNLGDKWLHHGEYAWRTQFAILGASWFAADSLELLGEASAGSTKMGAAPAVEVDFYSAYLMASYFIDAYRLSYRYDMFGADDVDNMDDENNDLGRSHTVALMWNSSSYKAGIELMYLDSKRSRALSDASNFKDNESVNLSVILQLRW